VCFNFLGDEDHACENFELAKVWGGKKAADMYHMFCEFSSW